MAEAARHSTSKLVRRLERFRRLDAERRALWLETMGLVVCVRVALWLLPFRIVRRALWGTSRWGVRSSGGASASRADLGEAVRAASVGVPAASCLVQALALEWLLMRNGHASRFRFGVNRGVTGLLAAHAWMEGEDGLCVSDPGDRSIFTPLPPI